MKPNITLDTAGIALSSLCIFHCLFLPVLVTALPLLGVVSEAEWVHKGLVILALPIALNLIISTSRLSIQFLSISGISILFAAAFLPQFHDVELVATMVGALLCGAAHLLQILVVNHSH